MVDRYGQFDCGHSYHIDRGGKADFTSFGTWCNNDAGSIADIHVGNGSHWLDNGHYPLWQGGNKQISLFIGGTDFKPAPKVSFLGGLVGGIIERGVQLGALWGLGKLFGGARQTVTRFNFPKYNWTASWNTWLNKPVFPSIGTTNLIGIPRGTTPPLDNNNNNNENKNNHATGQSQNKNPVSVVTPDGANTVTSATALLKNHSNKTIGGTVEAKVGTDGKVEMLTVENGTYKGQQFIKSFTVTENRFGTGAAGSSVGSVDDDIAGNKDNEYTLTFTGRVDGDGKPIYKVTEVTIWVPSDYTDKQVRAHVNDQVEYVLKDKTIQDGKTTIGDGNDTQIDMEAINGNSVLTNLDSITFKADDKRSWVRKTISWSGRDIKVESSSVSS